jgi:formiminoglutamase
MQPSKWSLVLVPDHLGVIHVGGRVGTDQGPRAFERVFSKLKGRRDLHGLMEVRKVVSGFNGTIETHHRQASDAVSEAHQATGLSVMVGGGHDHGFSHLRGLKEAQPGRWGCINLDAHLDVRKPDPVITSGSPFFLAIELGVVEPTDLVEFGIQSHCNSSALWEYARLRKIPIVGWSELRKPGAAAQRFKAELDALGKRVDWIAISLDLDALSQAHCPGVSAPQAEGFDPREVIEMLEVAASHPKVRSLGVFELNPVHDSGESTARVAATSAYHFVDAALSS